MSEPPVSHSPGQGGRFQWSGKAAGFLLGVVVFETAAQLLLKGGVGGHVNGSAWLTLMVAGGTAAYMGAFYCWLKALTLLDISVAVPLVSVSLASVAFGGWWFFEEPLGAQRIVGIGLIIAGATVSALFSREEKAWS